MTGVSWVTEEHLPKCAIDRCTNPVVDVELGFCADCRDALRENSGTEEAADTQPVCPRCVQWRCPLHGATCNEAECHSSWTFEPFWPNGQRAVLTRYDPCSECQSVSDDA